MLAKPKPDGYPDTGHNYYLKYILLWLIHTQIKQKNHSWG